jgi:hypothetical protein
VRSKVRLWNLLITLIEAALGVLARGKMFRHAEMPSGICFRRPYLCKIWFFMEQIETEGGFLLCFSGKNAACHNVFPISLVTALAGQGDKFWEMRASKSLSLKPK